MKVLGVEEIMTEVSDDVDLHDLRKTLSTKLKEDVQVSIKDSEVIVKRLLID